jgi:putative ABC transport system ATP-binding protein
MDDKPLVRAIELNKVYRSSAKPVCAVSNVSISITAGEFVAICGRSGSGKSSLLYLLGLLAQPDSGRYELDGADVSRLGERSRAAMRCALIGFVFQSPALLPRSTALQNVELPLVYSGAHPAERRRRAEEALCRVGLGDRLDRLPQQLSGGEQQRVSIARAIINNPALVLADEPTGALDSRTADETLAFFAALNRDGLTLCIVTHAREVADRARRRIVLQDGAVVEDSVMSQAGREAPCVPPIA